MPNLPSSELNIGQRIDASELSLALGITRQHLTRLCRAGKVPGAYRTKGGHWRFRWCDGLKAAVTRRRGPVRFKTETIADTFAFQRLCVEQRQFTERAALLRRALRQGLRRFKQLEADYLAKTYPGYQAGGRISK